MKPEIQTLRLRLLPLDLRQLSLCRRDLPALERELGLPIARGLIDANVKRALGMKIEKMRQAEAGLHEWFTYWLIVVRDDGVGAGFIGFKGYPDSQGSTEIGYGIDPSQRGRGYMTEAVRALADWAFAHPFCRVITATTVVNPASNRVLEKLGAQIVEATPGSRSWKLIRPSPGD